jgi:protein TonB
LPVKPPQTVTTVTRHIEAPPVQTAVPTDEGTAPMVPPAPVEVAPASPPAVPSAPVEATLAYVSAPAPAYPRVAINGRMQGTVTLRVLVDESGKPLDVVIESSSGHPVLDKAARDQVLAKWRFQPAQQNGQKVQAWARIPISFDLRNS